VLDARRGAAPLSSHAGRRAAQYWVLVLARFVNKTIATDFIIIEPRELLKRLDGIHHGKKPAGDFSICFRVSVHHPEARSSVCNDFAGLVKWAVLAPGPRARREKRPEPQNVSAIW